MKYLILISVFIFSLSVFSEEKIDDQTVFVSETDRAMNLAIEKAQRTLNDFLKIARNPPQGTGGFKLKVKVVDDNGIEHLWFSPFKEIEGGFAGLLVNQPQAINSMSYGEVYAFKKEQITDWGYVKDGIQIGSFTVCALFKTMEKEIVDRYKKDHGFRCE